ncbi:TPA: hypothetical protein ACJSUW_001817, partial [Streptococcus agalactiae]
QISQYYWFMGEFGKNIKKTNIKNDVCLHSETILCFTVSFLFSGYDSKLRLINFFLGRFTFVE